MAPYLIGKFIDEDRYTLHILHNKSYYLLAEFSYQQIPILIAMIREKYPDIANKLKKIKGE